MKKYYGVAVLGVVALSALVLLWSRGAKPGSTPASEPAQSNTTVRPHSFTECVDQGYPVEETQPRRCRAGAISFVDDAAPAGHDSLGVPVELDTLVPHAVIASPLLVTGKAPGTWFFEANIGLGVLDENGVEIARGHAEADGNWMTTEPVRFVGTIHFVAPLSATGFIEVRKDNPSDLPELDASIRVPIRFR